MSQSCFLQILFSPPACFQDAPPDKPVSLHSYGYDRWVPFRLLSSSSSSSGLCATEAVEVPTHCRDSSRSLPSDVASGKETSDGYESLASVGKADGKPRKHHRKSARTRSRQEKSSKPKLSMLNVRPLCGAALLLPLVMFF